MGLVGLQIEHGFGSHTEKEVEDREVGLEAIAMLEHLPVGFRLKVGVWLRMLGVDDITEVFEGCRTLAVSHWLLIFCRIFYLWMEIYQLTDLLPYLLVEIDQKVVFALKERSDVICVILEERALAIGTLQGVPMNAPPLVVVADADVLD